jgi:transcriptional regulator of aromatic amino acid metabolism
MIAFRVVIDTSFYMSGRVQSLLVIEVPPGFAKRRKDIPDLIAHFLRELHDPGAIDRIDRPLLDRIVRHEWPGHVRELRNVIVAAHAQSHGRPIDVVLSTRSIRHEESWAPDDLMAGQSFQRDVTPSGVERATVRRLRWQSSARGLAGPCHLRRSSRLHGKRARSRVGGGEAAAIPGRGDARR